MKYIADIIWIVCFVILYILNRQLTKETKRYSEELIQDQKMFIKALKTLKSNSKDRSWEVER